jgi:hypothetical protein
MSVPPAPAAPARSWPALVPALIAGVLVAAALGQTGPIVARDQVQERANLPVAGSVVRQTFVPARGGLSAFEVTAATDAPALDLALIDVRSGATLASAEVTSVNAGDTLRFVFEPLPWVAGHTLAAELRATQGAPAGLRAWDHDGYPGGVLTVDGQDLPGDLFFHADYTLLPGDVPGLLLGDVGSLLWLLALFVPGLAVLDWLERFAGGRRLASGWVRATLVLGLALAFWPLAWLLAPWRWSGWLAWLVVAAMLVYLAQRWIRPAATFAERARAALRRLDVLDAALLAVLLVTLATRLLAVRDVAMPMWVDSSRHALITSLFVENGRVPLSYEPLVDVPRFFYHFGFHCLAATGILMTGQTVDAVMLVLGQLLNALAALAAAGLATWLTRDRRAGLLAAFAVGILAIYPAYFVTWGRYTQLTGLVLLPAVMMATGEAFGWGRLTTENMENTENTEHDLVIAVRSLRINLGNRFALARGLTFTVLVAGLFLTHFRVFVFWLPWLLLAAAPVLWRLRPLRGPDGRAADRAEAWRTLRIALGAGALALLLVVPWLVQLVRDTLPATQPSALFESPGGYNLFPDDYFDRGYERHWLTVAFVLPLLIVAAGRRRALARHWRVLAVAAWTGLVLGMLNLDRLGGPSTWLVSNNSWAISLWLPASTLLGWGVVVCLDAPAFAGWPARVRALAENARFALAWAVIALAGYLAVVGVWQGLTIVNVDTILATASDRDALLWVAQNTPPNAVFLVNAAYWQTDTWIVPDGGAWLTPLAHRRATLPPIDYGFDRALRDAVNARNQRLANAPDTRAPEVLAELDALDVRYAFIARREGHFTADMLLADPAWSVAYTNGGTWIFERSGAGP